MVAAAFLPIPMTRTVVSTVIAHFLAMYPCYLPGCGPAAQLQLIPLRVLDRQWAPAPCGRRRPSAQAQAVAGAVGVAVAAMRRVLSARLEELAIHCYARLEKLTMDCWCLQVQLVGSMPVSAPALPPAPLACAQMEEAAVSAAVGVLQNPCP